MGAGTFGNPLDDPAYLRRESRRLRRIIDVLADPEIRKALAVHSFYMAQRAEALARTAEDPADIAVIVERHQPPPPANINDGERQADPHLCDEAKQALDGARALRDLAEWYRSFVDVCRRG